MGMWHDGELAVQRLVMGQVRTDAPDQGPLRSFMTDQHRLFFAERPFLVVGALGQDGMPWASLLTGEAGFVSSPTPQTLQINAGFLLGDALAGAIVPHAQVGVLGIDFVTRRRNRLNGRVSDCLDTGFCVGVDQSFGNCPKYITQRKMPSIGEATRVFDAFDRLDSQAISLISLADTFFVASFSGTGLKHGKAGFDVSHRGGPPGFLRVDADGSISVPDYVGNNYFNTLGNLMLNPKASLLFIDFQTGNILQLTGSTEIIWTETLEAQRFWRFISVKGVWSRCV